jgi:hypothetical protein
MVGFEGVLMRRRSPTWLLPVLVGCVAPCTGILVGGVTAWSLMPVSGGHYDGVAAILGPVIVGGMVGVASFPAVPLIVAIFYVVRHLLRGLPQNVAAARTRCPDLARRFIADLRRSFRW